MRTQETFALLQAAEEIRVALAIDGERIGGLLNERYPPPVLDGEPLFDHPKQMQHLLHELDSSQSALAAAEDGYMSQQVVVSRLQSDRDEAVGASYGKLVAVRQSLDGLHGTKAGFELALASGDTPRSADRLLEQLAQSVNLLRQPAVAPRDPRVAGINVDPAAVAADLESAMAPLRDVAGRLREARKRTEVLLVAKRKAIAELRRTILWAGRSAEGLFHRAGESELAERIRSSTRRPLRPSEEVPPEETSPEDPTDSPPDGATDGSSDPIPSPAPAEGADPEEAGLP
jgi:hypothetical protein